MLFRKVLNSKKIHYNHDGFKIKGIMINLVWYVLNEESLSKFKFYY